MGYSEAKVASVAVPKQGAETGETGFDERAAARKLLEISAEWLESDPKKEKPVKLLRCLCALIAESTDLEDLLVTKQDLARCVVRKGQKGSAWGVDRHGQIENEESARKAVTAAWKDLHDLWSRKARGVEERFVDAGWSSCPSPESETGGGRGKPTKYFIKLTPISESEAASASQSDAVSTHGVRYYTEDLELRRGMGAALAQGWPISGWRAVLTALIIFLVVSSGAIGAWMALASIAQAATTGHVVAVTLVTVLAAGLAWWVVGPLESLSSNRIALAPFWMQPASSAWDDRVLVLKPDFGRQMNRLYLARYSACCPVCGAPLHVASGRREFYGRLVGRCAATPTEHIFSFDHVTRTGLPLRRNLNL